MSALALSIVVVAPVGAASLPSGERILGNLVLEPVYDDMTGAVAYVATPAKAPNFPGKANPHAWAPFYLVVYPTGSTAGSTLDCMGVPGNCPDHDGLVAGAAGAIVPTVYGNGVIGHDHLMAGPGSGGDFNVTWEPVLVLFNSAHAANEHITTLAQITAALDLGDVRLVPVPSLTFLCAVVPAVVYGRATPVS
jgi:hypothetical protein